MAYQQISENNNRYQTFELVKGFDLAIMLLKFVENAAVMNSLFSTWKWFITAMSQALCHFKSQAALFNSLFKLTTKQILF